MAIFTFDPSHYLGTVRAVDTRRVAVCVESDEDLRKARVGQLVALQLPGPVDEWLIGIIAKVVKSTAPEELESGPEGEASPEEIQDTVAYPSERVVNTVTATLVGAVTKNARQESSFTRSLVQVPEINARCHVLRDKQLEQFMGLLQAARDTAHSLALGTYAIDPSATAYLDGNKLFQRHAALVGSTGAGKSWTVASLLERAAELPSANLVVFDLHGEYRDLSYAKHLRIPGPEDLGRADESVLFLPYWLLNSAEMESLFIERSEFTAHNQVLVFHESVSAEKRRTLEAEGRSDVLNAFTVDSPIPFDLSRVVGQIRKLNEEMIQGSRGMKQGTFHGQFSRLLARVEARAKDKRYGFLFQAPAEEHRYDAMASLVERLMGYAGDNEKIKVIDFSEVPAEVLPIIVGLVARLTYQVQFWTPAEARNPLAFVCDEAHLYIARKEGGNPAELRAIENFEKIGKAGRKYGVSLFIVTQRPSDVSPTVLSQCNNVLSLRLTNETDRGSVRRLLPESLESLLDALPLLDIGEALVVGDSVLLPSRIRITPPREKPLSATVDFWDDWQKAPSPPDFAKSVENMRRQSRK